MRTLNDLFLTFKKNKINISNNETYCYELKKKKETNKNEFVCF